MKKLDTAIQILKRLENQTNILQTEIKIAEADITPNNIKDISARLLQLETELRVTRQALQSQQVEGETLQKLGNSRTYQDHLRDLEKQKAAVLARAKAFYRDLQKLEAEAGAILAQTKMIDALNAQVGGVYEYSLRMKQPYSWLGIVQHSLAGHVKDVKWLKDKLT